MNEGDDGMSAAVAVGPPVVGYREEERGGGLLETDVWMIVLAFFLSPSHLPDLFIHTKVLTVSNNLGWRADSVDILIFLSRVTDFCLSASRSIDLCTRQELWMLTHSRRRESGLRGIEVLYQDRLSAVEQFNSIRMVFLWEHSTRLCGLPR